MGSLFTTWGTTVVWGGEGWKRDRAGVKTWSRFVMFGRPGWSALV